MIETSEAKPISMDNGTILASRRSRRDAEARRNWPRFHSSHTYLQHGRFADTSIADHDGKPVLPVICAKVAHPEHRLLIGLFIGARCWQRKRHQAVATDGTTENGASGRNDGHILALIPSFVCDGGCVRCMIERVTPNFLAG